MGLTLERPGTGTAAAESLLRRLYAAGAPAGAPFPSPRSLSPARACEASPSRRVHVGTERTLSRRQELTRLGTAPIRLALARHLGRRSAAGGGARARPAPLSPCRCQRRTHELAHVVFAPRGPHFAADRSCCAASWSEGGEAGPPASERTRRERQRPGHLAIAAVWLQSRNVTMNSWAIERRLQQI